MKKIYLFFALILSNIVGAQPPGWIYNQPITVTNPNAVAAVNYQLKLTVNTQSLIAAGKMLANGNDLRFGATCTGTVFFNYWIETGINTPTTEVWVKIPLIAANTSSTIFMFFGNAGAAAASSIPGTFRGPSSATDSVSGGTSGGLLVCQRGFRFSPNQNLLVTHFGKNEPSGSLRYVTLFNYLSQAIITQTQVAGPSATYSYGPIASPIWLTSGTQYVLQIYGLASDGYYYGPSSQIGQHLTYYDMQYSNGGTQNTFPTNTLANYHYGYGDFLYYVTNTLAIIPTYTLGGNLINITASSLSLCTGGSATLTTNASGSFTWSNGSNLNSIIVSPTVTSSYSVAETNSVGCNSNAIITISVNSAAPSLTITASTLIVCPTNTLTLNAAGALSYTWSGGITNAVPFSPLTTTTYTVSGQNGCGISTAFITVTVTPLPVVALANPSLVCAGNTSTLSGGGATTYTWMPGSLVGSSVVVSPQANTTYTVVGSTGVCAGIFTMNLSVNPNPTVTVSSTHFSICAGESATLTATGAIGYTWTPGGTGSSIVVSPIIPTGYNVVGVNSFGCYANANIPVIAYAGPNMNIAASTTLVCTGGSVSLNASGATTYSWSTGATTPVTVINPVSSAVYTVVGSTPNSPCATTKTVQVDVFTATISVSSPTAICIGESTTLNASGATTYNWSNGGIGSNVTVNPTTSTGYTVNGISTVGGTTCSSTGTTMVTVNPLPTVTASSTRTNICRFEFANITAGGASTYSWSNATTGTVLSVNPNSTTTYSVIGTDVNGCKASASIQIKVYQCVGLSETAAASNVLQIYPNPSSGEFSISAEQKMSLILVNELGQLINEFELNAENNFSAEVKGLANGVYFISSKISELQLNKKIVVQ